MEGDDLEAHVILGHTPVFPLFLFLSSFFPLSWADTDNPVYLIEISEVDPLRLCIYGFKDERHAMDAKPEPHIHTHTHTHTQHTHTHTHTHTHKRARP